MAYSSTGGTSSDTSSDPLIASLVTPQELAAIYAALGATTANVDVTLGTQSIVVSQPDTIILVDDTESDKEGLLSVSPDATGGISNIGQYATFVTNNTSSPVYVQGESSASFVEYQGSGPATLDGGMSQEFVADASHASGNNVLDASGAAGSYSYLIGGPGSDTLNGSTSPTGSAVLVAGSGNTQVNAGAGAATVYGGGTTTMIGGTHGGQLFLDYTSNSRDSMQAGSGGHDVLAVASGKNTLDDTSGNGTDTLYAGSGQDTLLGSTAGTTYGIGNGTFDIVSKGADNIYVSGSNSGTDSITGPTGTGVTDSLHFLSSTESAAQLNAQLQSSAASSSNGSATITFTTSGSSSSQTLFVANAVHVIFK